jgi:hypothetical protein
MLMVRFFFTVIVMAAVILLLKSGQPLAGLVIVPAIAVGLRRAAESACPALGH